MITVPRSTLVAVAGPIDAVLHEVRAATLTQAQPANSDPTGLFNEIDGAQTYDFVRTGPTAVTVTSAAARWRGDAVVVTWRTASEADALGFNLFRRVGDGPVRKVNRTLIAAKRAGQARGARYERFDRKVRQGARHTYRLQVVQSGGARSWISIGTA